jgi:4-carboxymuconolactone decarboxylase
MQRIPYPDVSALPETARRMLAGTPLNVVRIGAHASPVLFEAQGRLGWAIASPEVLEPRLRETVILRVAHLSESEYELRHHVPLARAAGLEEADLAAIATCDYRTLEPLLAAAARFTDEVVMRLSPSDETLGALRALVPDRVVVNIVLAIGCYMSLARLIAVTGIEPDAEAITRLPTNIDERAR